MKGAPRVTTLQQLDTHRLIPSKYRPSQASVLTRIADDDDHLALLFDLDNATNDRLQAENGRAMAIHRQELVFGVPNYRVVNATFCHPHPLGGRFNGPDRGAWYAGFALATAQAEIVFHKSLHLAEIDFYEDTVTFDDYAADFCAEFLDIRGDAAYAACLRPDSYVDSQTHAQTWLEQQAMGVVYPSVRHEGGTCIACFRPAGVSHVRRLSTWRFTWSGSPTPNVVRQEDSWLC